MGKWLDLAARLEAGNDPQDDRDNTDDSLSLAANVLNVPNVLAPLPVSIVTGVRLLQKMPAPRLLRPDAWPVAVADAAMVATDGWAVKALALGWSIADLYGAVTERAGDPSGDGLVVWLAGRKLLAIGETAATAETVTGFAFYHRRHQPPGARLLWEAGR